VRPKRPSARRAPTHLPMNRFLTSAAMRGSISTATHFLTFSRMRTVRLPVPGPTSSTTSVGLRNDCGQAGVGERQKRAPGRSSERLAELGSGQVPHLVDDAGAHVQRRKGSALKSANGGMAERQAHLWATAGFYAAGRQASGGDRRAAGVDVSTSFCRLVRSALP
jgi:hypothetical protein